LASGRKFLFARLLNCPIYGRGFEKKKKGKNAYPLSLARIFEILLPLILTLLPMLGGIERS